MKILGIIPARMASTRFPNKPMAKILNIPMIGHVYLRSDYSKLITDLYVATCDKIIYDYINSINGNCIMTSIKHERASDRTAEALLKIEKIKNVKYDIVVMIQGDEPMIYPDMIDSAVDPLIKDKKIKISNLMSEIEDLNEFNDPAEVKVVFDKFNDAIYFSREPIPSEKKFPKKFKKYKQVCIIPFTRDFLIKYNKMKQTPLEIIESIDMNRIIENGFKIKMINSDRKTYSVDTKEDLKKVNALMINDVLSKKYI